MRKSSSIVGQADALRLLRAAPQSLHDRLLGILGYEQSDLPVESDLASQLPSGSEVNSQVGATDQMPGEIAASATFGVVSRIEPRVAYGAPAAVDSVVPSGAGDGQEDPDRSSNRILKPSASLWSIDSMVQSLMQPLGIDVRGRQLDLPEAVQRIARQQVMHCLPYLTRTAQNRELILLVEHCSRIMPLWPELGNLTKAVRHARGVDLVRTLYLRTADGQAYDPLTQQSVELKSLASGAQILAIVVAESPHLQRSWAYHFGELEKTGAPIRYAELVTGTANQTSVNALLYAMARMHLPTVERMRLLAEALRNTGWQAGDAELLAVWNHKHRRGADFNWKLEPGRQQQLLHEFTGLPDQQKRALNCALQISRSELQPEAVALEQCIGASAGLEPAASDAGIKRVIELYHSADKHIAQSWLASANGPLSLIGHAGHEEGSWRELLDICGEVASEYGLAQPRAPVIASGNQADPQLALVSEDAGWRVHSAEDWPFAPAAYSGVGPWRDPLSRLDLTPGDLVSGDSIITPQHRITLQRKVKPGWADAIEHNQQGLEVQVGGRRVRWVVDAPAVLTANQRGGVWWDDSQYELHSGGQLISPPWADETGIDDYGLYAIRSYQNIPVKFRWISPGDFWMGSPEDELGRFDNETPHKVVLTTGFWLSETACSQKLWQAVTGDSPSEFTGENLPVESVSWQDITEKFLPQWNNGLSGALGVLPTEAQWEYACRAGTIAPFSFGKNLKVEIANYRGVWDFEDEAGADYRQRTMDVKSFSANKWGLYQMHGNVWEWCEDWRGDYENGAQVDPTGALQGQFRVLRGGSWDNFGRCLRSAYRFGDVPDCRLDFIGFRLAQVPVNSSERSAGSNQDAAEQGRNAAERR